MGVANLLPTSHKSYQLLKNLFYMDPTITHTMYTTFESLIAYMWCLIHTKEQPKPWFKIAHFKKMILTIYENRVESNQDTAWTIVWVKQDKKFI